MIGERSAVDAEPTASHAKFAVHTDDRTMTASISYRNRPFDLSGQLMFPEARAEAFLTLLWIFYSRSR